MSRCFAFVSNDSSLTGCALSPFEDALHMPEGAPHGWGMAYYQVGQPLLRKQPRTPPGPMDFVKIASKLRTAMIVGHVRSATVGGLCTENTHPFRYRNWVFCHSGTIEAFDVVKEEMLRSVPDFIRRNIRGKTDSEHLFHLFLSFLNDTGQLDDPRIAPDVAGRALASSFAYLDRLVLDKGHDPIKGCCIISNGNVVIGLRRGAPMMIMRQGSYTCPDSDGKPSPRGNLKAILLMGGTVPEGPGWEEVADGCIVTVDTNLNIETSTPI